MKTKPLTNEEISTLAMSLSHLIHSGIGVADALTLLKEDEKDRDFRALLASLADGADAGKSLSEVFRSSGRFPAYVCTLLEIGEKTGKPEQTLEAMARYYQGRNRLERQLRAAMLYPAVLLTVLLAVVAVLLIWVLPVFDDVYAQLGSGLTGFAGGLLWLGQLLKGLLPWLAGLLALLCCGALIPPIRAAGIGLFRKVLGDRGVSGRIHTARFVQALWLSVSSGMTAPEAATLAASLAEVPAFQKRCQAVLKKTEGGASLSQALRDCDFLSPSHCRLLEAGERCGRSEQVLEALAAQLLEAGEEDLTKAVGRVEPTLVILSSVLIGMILLSVVLPLLHIMSAIG